MPEQTGHSSAFFFIEALQYSQNFIPRSANECSGGPFVNIPTTMKVRPPIMKTSANPEAPKKAMIKTKPVRDIRTPAATRLVYTSQYL